MQIAGEHRFDYRTDMNRRPCAATSAGFSLIELLVVLAIFAILAMLCIKAFTGGEQKQQQKNCLKNLQKIYIAMEIFATDHKDAYPDVPGAKTSAEALDGLVPKYTVDTGSFICSGSKNAVPPAGDSIAKRKISYAYYMGRKKGTAEPLMSDEQVDATAKAAGSFAFSISGKGPGSNHEKSGNLLFGDGHAESVPARLPFSLVFPQGIVLLNP
jgi:prepilin-type N-terminal cleavage/methylation domain-containing protein/prepilin-type processing-associated H-X9-DG protein